jgi:hypothetical protein
MMQALAISLAVVVAFALLSQATAAEKRPRKSAPITSYTYSGAPEGGKAGKALKAKPKTSKSNFQPAWPSKVDGPVRR